MGDAARHITEAAIRILRIILLSRFGWQIADCAVSGGTSRA
jgi:hypothetical protein